MDARDDAAGTDRAARVGPFGTSRLEAFSDGVFAVIITITALELRAPAGWTWSSVAHRLPNLLIYVLSFLVIGIYWNNHHHLLRVTDRIDGGVMWSNLHLLFWLSLIPVMTEWVGRDYDHPVPACVFGIVFLGAAVAYWVLVRMILRANPHDARLAAAIGSDRKGKLSIVGYVAGAGLAFVVPWLAYVCFAAVAAVWFIPDRRLV